MRETVRMRKTRPIRKSTGLNIEGHEHVSTHVVSYEHRAVKSDLSSGGQGRLLLPGVEGCKVREGTTCPGTLQHCATVFRIVAFRF